MRYTRNITKNVRIVETRGYQSFACDKNHKLLQGLEFVSNLVLIRLSWQHHKCNIVTTTGLLK